MHSDALPAPDTPQAQDPLALMAAVDGIFWEARSPEMRFTFVSAQCRRILGHPPAAWCDDRGFWQDRVHPEDRAATLRWWRRVGQEPGRHQHEYRLRHADGSYPWVSHLAFMPLDAESDAIVRGVILDISSRRRVQRARASQAALIEAVFHNAPDPMFIVDTERRIQAVNPSLLRATGYRAEELIGESTARLYDDPAEFERLGRLRFADGDAGRPSDDGPLYTTYRRKSGETFPVETCGSFIRGARGETLGFLVVLRDISDRHAAQQRLRESEERFRQYAELAADYFWESDEHLVLTRIDGHFENSWGMAPDSVLGRTHLEAILPYVVDPARAARHAQTVARHLPFDDLEFRPPRPDGRSRVVQTSARPVFATDGAFVGYRGVSRDITEQREMAEKLAWQAAHDPLTGLVNRREFERRLQRALDDLKESAGTHCLCYLDLDQFKLVNDTCGHSAGDELLRQVSTLLGEHLRSGDTLARLGGDEFGILLGHCPLASARQIAESLRRSVEAFRFHWDAKTFTVGVSIGLVPLGPGEATVASAMSAADSACYVAKENGRNRVHVSDGNDEQVSRRHTEMEWVERLTRALDEDRLELWHQPIVNVADACDESRRFEVLVRMRNDDGNLVAPGVFLPAAERYGLAARLDRWVLEHTLAWCEAHADDDDAPLTLVSVNLSAQSLCDEDFAAFARAAVAAATLDPRCLCFEIAETTAIQNLAAATRFIGVMRELGCRFALDDFGSGVSSFAYLKRLDVDYLKLDGTFVKDIEQDPVNLAMVRSINDVGHVMGKRIIAEFVENDGVIARLQGIGVDYAQGFAIACPCPLPGTPDAGAEPRTAVVTPLRRRRHSLR